MITPLKYFQEGTEKNLGDLNPLEILPLDKNFSGNVSIQHDQTKHTQLKYAFENGLLKSLSIEAIKNE